MYALFRMPFSKKTLCVLVLLCACPPGSLVLLLPATAWSFVGKGPPNVLLVTIDSLRPDHLGAYGYTLPTSPHIDRIASEGTLFANAISQGGWTSPALVSLFTSTYPSVHGVEARDDSFPCARNSVITTWLRAGYRVPAYEGIRTEHNYARLGFEPQSTYRFTLDALKSWIQANRSHPFFCWYHINKTPHLPYNPDTSLEALFLPKGFSASAATKRRLETVRTKVIIPKGSLDLQEEDRLPLIALYDGEVRMADEAVSEIYSFLAAQGLLDTTIFVITADHGDELMDHGFIGHASTSLAGSLYDEIIHVPLILRYPAAIPSGRVVEQVVESIDIMPTLLELARLEAPPWVQGTSLLAAMRTGPAGDDKPAVAFSESCPCGYQCKADDPSRDVRLVSLRSSNWKLIVTHAQGASVSALYDLREDPRELRNVADKHAAIVDQLKDSLLTWYHENRLLRKALEAECAGGTE